MRKRLRLPVALIAAALSMAAPAHAIDWILGQPIMAPQQMWSLMDDKDLGGGAGGFTPEDVQMAQLIYRPSPARTQANLAAFVERTRAVDPAGAAQLQAQFASGDVIGAIDAAMQQVGLDKDNLADAYTVWAVNAWSAAHGDLSETTPATAIAVSRQAAQALLATPEVLALDDAGKQEMAESMLVQAALIAASQQAAAGDPAMTQQVAQAVRQGALASGLDLDQIRLTEAGFVPAGS